MGIAVVKSRSSSEPSPAAPAVLPVPAAGASPAAAPAARPLAETLREEAAKVLGTYLVDPSPRLRVKAASALSRTGHDGAVAELERALAASEDGEIQRLEVAYPLARAGNDKGVAFLTSSLDGSRRDVRLEAARYLVRLGDTRGQKRLREAMSLAGLRLSAAESLAVLGDPEAFQVLREALTNGSKENRMRAAVALGRAGDGAGLELLKELVKESRVELGAASALARLGDAGCAPALQRALGLTALRVEAAVALRGASIKPDLEPLSAALAAGDVLGRISAAEAVLVLTEAERPAELRGLETRAAPATGRGAR
jgi:HEAT repeat protein